MFSTSREIKHRFPCDLRRSWTYELLSILLSDLFILSNEKLSREVAKKGVERLSQSLVPGAMKSEGELTIVLCNSHWSNIA